MKTLTTHLAMTITLLALGSVAQAAGQDHYQNQCAACHGQTGAGDGPLAGQNGLIAPPPFSKSVVDRMTVERAMREGVNNVPGHGNASLFVGNDLQALVDYVYQLAHP